MALENVMRVDNGNIITGGGAGGNSVEIDWEDWCELTPEEQETGDWTIINCPWADGDVSVDLMTKLWENPSPTSAFADQNISLSSDNYDLLLILYVWNVSGQMLSTIVKKSEKFVLSAGLPSANGARDMARYASFVSDTIIHFIDATDSVGTSSSTTNNNRCIPIIIYGIKLTATVKINAIAMDVSTSADKCMLSDGETSVEEAVDAVKNNNWVTLNNKVKYRVSGGFVYISARLSNTNNTWTSIGTMPEGLRPSNNVYHCCYYRPATTPTYGNLYCNTGGVIQQIANDDDIHNGFLLYPVE